MPDTPPDRDAARTLLVDIIDSFEKLEIVVHLHSVGFAPRSASQIAKAIALPLEDVEPCFDSLVASGILDPKGPRAAALSALVQMYQDDRIEVLNLMTKAALDRVRRDAARTFADAFVLRPKKKGDPDA